MDSAGSKFTKIPEWEIKFHAHLNTSGLHQESRELMQNPRWSSISVSLHHYDTGALQVLYGLKHKVEMPVLAGIDVSKVNAGCNLVRDFGAPNRVKFR